MIYKEALSTSNVVYIYIFYDIISIVCIEYVFTERMRKTDLKNRSPRVIARFTIIYDSLKLNGSSGYRFSNELSNECNSTDIDLLLSARMQGYFHSQ